MSIGCFGMKFMNMQSVRAVFRGVQVLGQICLCGDSNIFMQVGNKECNFHGI